MSKPKLATPHRIRYSGGHMSGYAWSCKTCGYSDGFRFESAYDRTYWAKKHAETGEIEDEEEER